jgi:glycosyltransferase involved in cell wall biosynthesis
VLQAAEAFVLPSHQENFGIAVAEALSCGTPVLIAHPVNISPEIAADGAGLAEADTREGCLRLLRKWLALPAAAQTQMRSQARVTFDRRYTSENSAKDLIKTLQGIIRP